MTEIIKLLALMLILMKDSLKLGQVIADCRKDWRTSRPTMRQVAGQLLAILFAVATLMFYASDLTPHFTPYVA